MADRYDAADFYDASDDPENLRCETDIEAIEALLDSWTEPNCDMATVIAEHGACTVVAWARRQVSDAELERHADFLAEAFSERIDDEYANPDGKPCLSDGVDAELRAALLPVLRAAVTRANIWACEEVGRRSYSAEEVDAMMRDENPDWFEPEDHTDD